MSDVAIVPFQEKVTKVRVLLEKSKAQIARALPKHLDADRMSRIAMTSIQRAPALLDCTPSSLIGAIIQASQLGLECDGVLGHAYLIPYRDQCQLIVGYKGLLKLARNSGDIKTISARVVYAEDEFNYSYGLNERCEHVPSQKEDRGSVAFVYAVAKLKDGGEQFEVLSIRDVERVRQRSRAGSSGPWVTDFEEMAKKTVLRRLCKMLPSSADLVRAVALDERVDAGISQDFEDVVELATEDSVPKGQLGKLIAASAVADAK